MRAAKVLFIALCATAVGSASALISYEQALQQHHIALTRAALVAALRDSNDEVRSLAAAKLLVNDHALDEIPAVRDALAKEDVPETRINTAFALAEIGDEMGLETLEKSCSDDALNMAMRLKAASYSLMIGREFCVGAVKDAMRPEQDHDLNNVFAISLVSGFKKLSPADDSELTAILIDDLSSGEPLIRGLASQSLGMWSKVTAIPNLQAALAVETDDLTRSQMERVIENLSKAAAQ